jgi:predicted 2-oxoglutarate/Fe(II)-dependent dioxygenase YbiX
MGAARTRPLSRGERAPDFTAPSARGTPTRFYAVAGGAPTALVFGQVPGTCPIAVVQVLERAAEARHPVFADRDGSVRALFGVAAGEERIFVLDANLRVLESLPPDAAQGIAEIARASIPKVEASEVVTQAPVLLVPGVLDPDICSVLMQVFEERGHVETGVEESYDGMRGDVLREEAKRRRDHVVADESLIRDLTSAVGRRVIPEIQRAFSFRATRFEGFKIARYDAPHGHFRAHRDNLSPKTAHRRFALTLNLNDGYAGGQLRFPEYGPLLYRPPAGGALLFSCSLLHEVVPVSDGHRFVLLSFLFGDDDAASRTRPTPAPR